MPVGLQIVAPNRGEAKLLAGAAFIENVLGLGAGTPIDPRVTHSRLIALLAEVRACTLCCDLPLGPNPLAAGGRGARAFSSRGRPRAASPTARAGRSMTRPATACGSGSASRATRFTTRSRFAVLAMGFCYPGTGKGGDLPPRPLLCRPPGGRGCWRSCRMSASRWSSASMRKPGTCPLWRPCRSPRGSASRMLLLLPSSRCPIPARAMVCGSRPTRGSRARCCRHAARPRCSGTRPWLKQRCGQGCVARVPAKLPNHPGQTDIPEDSLLT
jgi:hypothetical protein